MLSQTGGSIARPTDIGGYADAKHYRIPEPDGWPTVYGVMTFDLGPGGHVLLGFTSCRRFIGRFSFNDAALRISVDPEGLELAPGETWKLEEFLAVAGPDRNALFDQLAADIALHHPPLPQPSAASRIGWCTWYGVGGAGNQKIITESAQRFASVLPELKFIPSPTLSSTPTTGARSTAANTSIPRRPGWGPTGEAWRPSCAEPDRGP